MYPNFWLFWITNEIKILIWKGPNYVIHTTSCTDAIFNWMKAYNNEIAIVFLIAFVPQVLPHSFMYNLNTSIVVF